MNTFLAFMSPGPIEMLLIVLGMATGAIIPILVVFWFARKLLENSRENTRLRLEVGKLADELEQVRKQQQAK
jgi:hypothetical protein